MTREDQIKKAAEIIAYGCSDELEAALIKDFHELKESEDERITRAINNMLPFIPDDAYANNGVTKEGVVRWLEKQKEQKPEDRFEEARKKYQVEWSEEDKDAINGAIGILLDDNNPNFVFPEHSKLSVGEIVKRLKSLSPQPNKEIYQAAKHDLAIKFMNYLDENRPEGKMGLSNVECEDIDKAFKENDWEKIIRYANKYSWKPSEEQMKALNEIINTLAASILTKATIFSIC